MKLKIKVKEITEGCMPEINPKGDWIDLRAAEDLKFTFSKIAYIDSKDNNKIYMQVSNNELFKMPLGVAMELPKGFEAVVAPRSSTPFKFNFTVPNSFGVIDNSYNGDTDEWKCTINPISDIDIKKGDRICQFRIQLSQKATIWQKLKWLFSSGVKLDKVDNLNNNDRGGFGTSGVN